MAHCLAMFLHGGSKVKLLRLYVGSVRGSRVGACSQDADLGMALSGCPLRPWNCHVMSEASRWSSSHGCSSCSWRSVLEDMIRPAPARRPCKWRQDPTWFTFFTILAWRPVLTSVDPVRPSSAPSGVSSQGGAPNRLCA